MNSPGSILIVDDNPQNIQVLGAILQTANHSLSIVMNGADALSYLKTTSVDLVLLDVMMPGLSGFEVCEKIKADPNLKDIPVIFLTAKSDLGDLIKGFEAGAVDYVTKPFQAAELLARVKTHIALHRSTQEIIRLQGILPICSCCRKIRDDDGYWQQVEEYLVAHTEVRFSHGICNDCVRTLYPDIADRVLAQ